MKPKENTGLLCAFLTILIWGTTYVSTKVLLKSFAPVEILFIRFILGYVALWIVCPKVLKLQKKGQEKYFVLAGLSGITFYYLLENIALVYTTATNVGIIISVAPFFTGILSWLILKEEKPSFYFFTGFLLAIVGIFLISVQSTFDIHPKGDLLALLAAAVWSIYSILTKKINTFGYSVIQVTRRTFFYGMIFMVPFLFVMGFQISVQEISQPVNIANLLFLGLGASALCFVTWNFAVKVLGAVKTSVFIYLVPIITTVSAVFILHETIAPMQIVGIVFTLFGLLLSGKKTKNVRETNEIAS